MGIHRRVVWMVDGWVLFHEVWRGNVIRDISARLAEEVAERVWSTSWDMSFLVLSYFGVLGSWIHRFWGLSVGDASAGKDCMLHDEKKVFETPWVGALPARIMREAAEARLHWKPTWAKVQRWSFDKRLSESSQKDHFFKLILVRLHFAGMTGLLLLQQFSKALLFFIFVCVFIFNEIS